MRVLDAGDGKLSRGSRQAEADRESSFGPCLAQELEVSGVCLGRGVAHEGQFTTRGLSNMRFSAKAGTEYEVTLASFPTQLFTLTDVHVYEVVKAPYEFRAVEQTTSYEPDPSSCPNGRGMVR